MTDTNQNATIASAMRHIEALERIRADPTASRNDMLFDFNIHIGSTPAEDVKALEAAVAALCLEYPGTVPEVVAEPLRRMIRDTEQASARRLKSGVTTWTGSYALDLFKDAVTTMRTLAIRGGRDPVSHLTRADLDQLERVPSRLVRATLAALEDAAPAIHNAASDKKAAADQLQVLADLMASTVIPSLAVPMALITGDYQDTDSGRNNWDGPTEIRHWGCGIDPHDGERSLVDCVLLVDRVIGRIVKLSKIHAPQSNPNADEFRREVRGLRENLTDTLRRIWLP